MKLPDGFEGVVIPEHQIFLAQMLSYYKPQLEKVASALSTATFMMVPFFYAFLQAGWVFRYILYPLVFVAPWVMMALKHDVYTMHVIYKTAPIAGFVILLICLRSIFNRRAGKPLDYFIQLLKFLALTVLSLITPIVPY